MIGKSQKSVVVLVRFPGLESSRRKKEKHNVPTFTTSFSLFLSIVIFVILSQCVFLSFCWATKFKHVFEIERRRTNFSFEYSVVELTSTTNYYFFEKKFYTLRSEFSTIDDERLFCEKSKSKLKRQSVARKSNPKFRMKFSAQILTEELRFDGFDNTTSSSSESPVHFFESDSMSFTIEIRPRSAK